MPLTPNGKNGYTKANTIKIYTALLSQSGTNAPTAIILQNTIGDIIWSRNDAGGYYGTKTGAFPENKTTCLCQTSQAADADGAFTITRDNDNRLLFITSDILGSNGQPGDDWATNVYIEITIKP